MSAGRFGIRSQQPTDIEYDRYQEIFDRIAKLRLGALVQGGAWLALPGDDEQWAVTKSMKAARTEAKAQLFGWTGSSGSNAPPPGFRMDKLPLFPVRLTVDR